MNKILVAYDGGDPSRRALETAAELARALGATVSVVSVVPFHPGRAPLDPWDDAPLHSAELREARQVLLEHGIEAELIQPVGDPAPTIERIAEEGQFDTVILGSRGLGPLGRALQGSVSEHVATHSQATVVITH
jgi:nucleotide-binding universal stress UspA family protein